MNKLLSKLQSEAVKGLMELKETLIYDAEVSDEDAERDAENQIKQFLSDQIQKAYDSGLKTMLDTIGDDQGWEESRDIYADALCVPLKYPKLMEEYKKRNHIKGRIILDSQRQKLTKLRQSNLLGDNY